MDSFIKKHGAKLKATALIAMLVIPFFLYPAAMHGSILQVKLIMAVFILNMLFVMKSG
jgi:hypothetical protein